MSDLDLIQTQIKCKHAWKKNSAFALFFKILGGNFLFVIGW